MKIKRYTAKNMREAIRMVREEQGPDAVILSNRRVPEGIEVVSATDYDAALIQQALRQDVRTEKVTAPSFPHPIERERIETRAIEKEAPAPKKAPPSPSALAAAEIVEEPIAHAAAAPVADPAYAELKRELNSMRSLIENQISNLVWDQVQSRHPRRASLMRTLVNLCIAPALAREIVAELPQDANEDQARVLPLGALARRIPVTTPDIIMQGGVIALIGATGVGKTTTIAKLAARFAARHGTRDLALVTTDTYRIGAQEQLHTYGRLLGVPVHTARDGAELDAILQRLGDRKLVLIDTAGLAPRDEKLGAQLQALARCGRVHSYLALPASSQAGDLDQAAQRFGATPLKGAILTKLDEATRLGGVLSTVIRRNLPVAYCCDGQRVPEDLQIARPYHLAVRAQHLTQQTPAAVVDDGIALHFGAAHVAA